MRVLILTRYDHMGASSRVRFLQYIPFLERAGLQCDVQYLFSNASLARLYATGRRSARELVGALGRRIAAVLDRAARGDLENRVVRLDEGGESLACVVAIDEAVRVGAHHHAACRLVRCASPVVRPQGVDERPFHGTSTLIHCAAHER